VANGKINLAVRSGNARRLLTDTYYNTVTVTKNKFIFIVNKSQIMKNLSSPHILSLRLHNDNYGGLWQYLQTKRPTVTKNEMAIGRTLIGNLMMLSRVSDVKALLASNTPPVSTYTANIARVTFTSQSVNQ